MTDQHTEGRRTSPAARAVSAGLVLVICLGAGALLLLSFDPFDDLDKGDALIVNLYATGLSILGIAVSGIAYALRLVPRNWVAATGILLALTLLIGAYRFFTY